ncbi:translocation/assembly module TamB domain-containing protein [Parasphingopyxis marina]|uniref:Translocation/assembly module TamB domain-containing protein n=1 Tax=Parasphingopyxis marina TaxID=2761622 RepID=A0A842I387_9SPHN|nr:translocation/assembly module TamB domain-containing protein [Parasphingopyxis marina]MBC2778414.1 translocation/assembly module TamB domain-containing protein [Parasphingopyxis marina]
MVQTGAEIADGSEPPRRDPLGRRLFRGAMIAVAGLVILLIAIAVLIDTPPGRRFIIDRIEAMEPANGMRIRIGRIDGSIYSQMTVSDLRLYDPDGLFFEAPELGVDWNPLAYLFVGRLDIDDVRSDFVILHKLPALIPSEEEDQPILPGFDIRIGTLDIERFRFAEAVTGERRDAALSGNADIRSGRARITLDAHAIDGGERLALMLDAEPDGDIFDIDLDLQAPEGGILAGLTGIRSAVTVDIAGSGTWSQWDGYARVDSGEARAVDLTLAVRDGSYVLAGVVRSSDLFDPGLVTRLSAPEMNLAAHATFEERRLTGDFDIRSRAAVIEGRGVLDFAASAFDGFVADIRLLQPAALVDTMRGADVRMRVALDGPFDRAGFAYRLTAQQAAIGSTGFQNLQVAGEGRLSETPFTIPVRARASRITGFDAETAGVLRNASIDGALLVTADQIVGDDLRLRSDRLRGTASAIYDLASGDYAVALNADIDRYRLPGLGTFDVATRVDVRPAPGGRFAIAGRARAVARTLENGFAASLTEGLPTLDASIAYRPDGRLGFADARLRSPGLRFTGQGHIDGNGQIHITGSGEQAQYGPLRLTASGSPSRPHVDLALARPVSGITDVEATLDPTATGYAYSANGQSPAGPFTSIGAIQLPANAPVAIDVAELLVSDTRSQGRLVFADGGVVGSLDLTGSGLDGDVVLAVENGNQVVTANLSAEDAQLGGMIDATVREALLELRWSPSEGGSSVQGSLSMTGFRRRGISIARFAGSAELENGYGSVTASLAGARGRRFDFSASADITPESIAIEGDGTFRGEPITLTPLVVRKEEEGWVIPESTIRYADGGATVAARFGGPTTEIEATLENIPLSLIDIAYPETGFGGQATGGFLYRIGPGETVPTANAELRIRSLTREGFALRPRPVNLGINARLDRSRLALRAIMESDGEDIMRVQARLDPLNEGAGTLGEILAAAPLFAEVRYSGPAETLWQLTGNETMSLSGELVASADASGTLNNPQITGALSTTDARFESALTGTVVEHVSAEGTFQQAQLDLPSISGTTPGGGTLSGRASFNLGLASGLGMDVALEANEAWLLRRDDITAQVTGPLTITLQAPAGTATGTDFVRPVGEITGDFDVVRGSFQLGQAAPSLAIPELNVTEINGRTDEPDPPAAPIKWNVNVDVDARNRFMVRGLGLDSEWGAALQVRGSLSSFGIYGNMDLRRGTYEFAGRSFDLERGRIDFYGSEPVDPALDIVAGANVEGLTASINIGGTGSSPEISFTSVPALPQSELLSRLLFGTSITNLSAPEALQLGAAVASLQGGGGGGLNPINAVRDAIGLDRLRIVPADPAEDRGTAIAAGVYVTRNLFVEVISDGQGYSATETEFRITRWLSLLGSISTIGRAGGNLQISRDY